MPAHAEAAASAPPAKRLRANGHAADGEAAASPAAAQQALSAVEAAALRASGRQALRLGDEKAGVLEVGSFPLLGRLVALRFIEWAQRSPGGVCALPTGRTPEHFINWTKKLLEGWDEPGTRELLEEGGVDVRKGKPDMASLRFVQLDDFYPMHPSHPNRFTNYVRALYVDALGMDQAKAMLMDDLWTMGCDEGTNAGELFEAGIDLTLRDRPAASELEERQARAIRAVDEYCSRYEAGVRAMGGIGFFLGGIGPDGHVAFNCRGAPRHCVTRLTATNYETQAAAAGDLGGIEMARVGAVVTIGLDTITHNKDCVALIMAAGDAKAAVVRDAVQRPMSDSVPCSALRDLPHARFILTHSAASKLAARRTLDLFKALNAAPAPHEWRGPADVPAAVVECVTELALRLGRRVCELRAKDCAACERTRHALRLGGWGCAGGPQREALEAAASGALALVEAALKHKVGRGVESAPGLSYVHTAPHHDDIMLGYLPLVRRMVLDDSSQHMFLYATSGFNAVTNAFMVDKLTTAAAELRRKGSDAEAAAREGRLRPAEPPATGADADARAYLAAHAARDERGKRRAVAARAARCAVEVTMADAGEAGMSDPEAIAAACDAARAYYEVQLPGAKDTPLYQQLKGSLREFEADLLWSYHGFGRREVGHLRLGFYKGERFTEEPEEQRDAVPLLASLVKARPDVVTVAFDPEGSGPDTHYKVLQAVAQALRLYRTHHPEDAARVRVWGYRNVWFRFSPAEATHAVPCSPCDTAAMNDSFEACFLSQFNASFPSPDHDGPFSHQAQMVQAAQLREFAGLLGADYFRDHEDRRLRAAHALVLVKEMQLDEFLHSARELQSGAEGAGAARKTLSRAGAGHGVLRTA